MQFYHVKKGCSIDKQKLLNVRPCLTSESHLLLMKLRIFFRGPRGIPNPFRSLSWQRALKGTDINREKIKHCLSLTLFDVCVRAGVCVPANYQ